MVVRAVDVYKQLAEGAQRLDRRGGVVHVDAAAARCRNRTPHEQHAVLARRQTRRVEKGVHHARNGKRRLDAGLLRAVPHGRGVSARAQHEFKRAHEHALARAGLAGDDSEATAKFDVRRFDDGQVPH